MMIKTTAVACLVATAGALKPSYAPTQASWKTGSSSTYGAKKSYSPFNASWKTGGSAGGMSSALPYGAAAAAPAPAAPAPAAAAPAPSTGSWENLAAEWANMNKEPSGAAPARAAAPAAPAASAPPSYSAAPAAPAAFKKSYSPFGKKPIAGMPMVSYIPGAAVAPRGNAEPAAAAYSAPAPAPAAPAGPSMADLQKEWASRNASPSGAFA